MLDTLRPPALPLDILQPFAQERYGLSGAWSALEGERDQNYRIKAADGSSVVFKVCHPAEGDAVLQCQAAALEHIAEADPTLPVPRLIRTRDGLPLAPPELAVPEVLLHPVARQRQQRPHARVAFEVPLVLRVQQPIVL